MTLLKKIALLIATAGVLLVQPASAALTYNDGDLFLAFRAANSPGATTDILVDIGSDANFLTGGVNATGSKVSLSLGNFGADLASTYGASWFNRSDLFWSVVGVQKAATASIAQNTNFASAPEPTIGTQSTPWTRASVSASSGYAGKIQAMGQQFQFGSTNNFGGGLANGDQVASSNSTVTLLQPTSISSSYASYTPGGVNSGPNSYFSAWLTPPGIEGNFGSGTAGTALDLYKLAPDSANPKGPGSLLGSFSLTDAGTLAFTSPPTGSSVALDKASYTVNDNAGSLAFTITRSGDTSSAFSVTFSAADGSATTGTDYTATNVVLQFAAGDTTKTTNVSITNTPGFQPDRSFTVSLTAPTAGVTLGTPNTATVTIHDSSTPANVALSASTYSITEGASPNIAVTINRTGDLTSAFSVNFATSDGTAQAGIDYTATSPSVAFAANDTTKTVNVPVASIAGFQGDRNFNVAITLSGSPVGVTLGTPNTVVVTIHESSANTAGNIAFTAGTYTFPAVDSTAQPNTLQIPLTRTGGTTGSVSVNVSAASSKLVSGTDFTFTNPTVVTFPDGVATQNISLALKAITPASKLPATITLTLSSPTNHASLGTITSAGVTINPPDKSLPTITLTAVKAPTAPPPGNTITVAGTAGDNLGVDHVVIKVNGGAPQLATLGTPVKGKVSFSLTGVALANGKNVITAQAFDASGNKSALSSLSLTYVNNRPALAGPYNGLLVPAVTPSNNNSGLVTLMVTPSGIFTGKVSVGGLALSIGGVFGNDGVAHFNPTLATTFAVKANPKATSLGDLALSIAEDATTGSKVVGTLTLNGPVANLNAPRAFFDGKTPATTVDPKFLKNKGIYTVVIPAKAQAGSPSKSTYPQGDGIGTITVTKSGSVSLVGTLADGTPVMAQGALSKDYQVPLFKALYKTGSLAGVIKLDDTQADSDLKGLDLLWIRPAIPTSKYYPVGWPNGIRVDLLGAEYAVPPVAKPPVSVFPGLNAAIPATTANATLKFSDGVLTPGTTITKTVHIAGNNAVTNVPPTDKTFTLGLSAASGGISGVFTHTDGKKVTYKGMIFEKGSSKGAYGFFLSTPPVTKPPAAPGIGESGGVSLNAN